MEKDWVEDRYGEVRTIGRYPEFTRSELNKLFVSISNTIDEAVASGWKDVKVSFQSTIEPYEDCPGDVEVEINGLRKLDETELEKQSEQARIQLLAVKLGISFYEASVVDRLEKIGKVKV